MSTSVGRLLRTAGVPRSSEERLSHAYHLLMTQLHQEHAEIRLSAFQVVDELFVRSQHFRTLVVSDFQAFLELTLGTDHKQPLPPPKEVARRLRQAAARAVQGWSEKFGAAYKKLALGHHFLRHSHQVDFADVDVRTPVERRRGEEQQRHRDRLYRARAEQAVREMAGGALRTGGPAFQPEPPVPHLWWSCHTSGQGEGTCIQLVVLV
ncbi:UV-stimulated scaffold protein A-like isoform X2 [Pteropus vampyrus]|uniref:UV-stimulated scaffold protein A n=1 Tax=Pteropus vampyrus TaxID=132908 RepID=A0A6P3RTS6_PTEVA|nr:UV-stimulated scaffold protein A-like isoform X1 [Pteropus vampyrus]XP_023382882.1 UV-stimulated scaffold protein A-like isoform X2 [Pteropus vampyrus]